MLDAKYGFAQSMDCAAQTMDCAAQTMDPYFVRAIHGLRIHVYTYMYVRLILNFLYNFFGLILFSFFKSVHVHDLHKPASYIVYS